jgi:Protein of unknown function (DUF4199)
MTMFNKILKYGCIAGLLVGVPLSVITIWGTGHIPNSYGLLIGYLTMLIALSAIFVAVKRHRDLELGGVIGFWPAFGMGLGISLIAGVFYVTAWEAATTITHMDFAGSYAKSVIAQAQAKGISDAALAKLTTDMDEFKVNYSHLWYRLPMTFAEIFPVGVLVSLVAAGLLRNRRFLPLRRQRSLDS